MAARGIIWSPRSPMRMWWSVPLSHRQARTLIDVTVLSCDRFERERQRQIKPIFAVHMNVEQLDRRCDLVPALRLHAVVALSAVPFVSKHIVLCDHHDVGVPLVSVKQTSFVNEESDVVGKVQGACFASRI